MSEPEVIDALRPVQDPELHRSIVDLGMVKDVVVEGRSAKVTLLLDDPICVYTFVIQHEICRALEQRGIEDVQIEICADELWTADRLSDSARIRLGRRPTNVRRHGGL